MSYPPADDRLRHLLAQRINCHVDTWKLAFFIAGAIVDDSEIRAELDRVAAAHAAGRPCGDRNCRACFTASTTAPPAAAPVPPTADRAAVRAQAFRDAAGWAYLNVHAAAAEGVRRWLLACADAELRRMAAEEQPAETLCRCGHGRDRHAPDVYGTGTCADCPGDEERSWRHPYTPTERPAVGEQPETQETDEPVCADEFPGDDLHAGQICTLRPGHVGQHRCTAEIAGTDFTRRLMWPNRERP